MRARRTPSNQAHVTNHKEDPALLAAEAGERGLSASYGERVQAQDLLAQSSFLSVNDSRLHVGLGTCRAADLSVRWAGGNHDRFLAVPCDELVTVIQGEGIIRSELFS